MYKVVLDADGNPTTALIELEPAPQPEPGPAPQPVQPQPVELIQFLEPPPPPEINVTQPVRFYYAQLSEGVVIAKSDLSAEVQAAHMIPLQSLDDCQLGDLYENGQFTAPLPADSEA